MKLTIGVDLDSTVSDLLTPWLGAYNRDHAATHGELRVADIATWDHLVKLPIGMAMLDYLKPAGFFRALRPLPGAVDALRRMSEQGHRIVIISASEFAFTAPEKADWVKEHLPFVHKGDVFFGANKELLRVNVFIDDGPHNLEAYRKAWPHAHLATIAYPYNQPQSAIVDCRAHGWSDTAAAWDTIAAFVERVAE